MVSKSNGPPSTSLPRAIFFSVGWVGHCFVNGRLRLGDIEFRFGVTR